jgi:Family of unknown function (DUF6294)
MALLRTTRFILCLLIFPLSSSISHSQPQPTPAPAQAVPAAASPSDLDQCKAGNAKACMNYSTALAAACSTAGTPGGQIFCSRKASCYSDRSLGLSQGNAARTPSTDSCDAQGIGTDPFPNFVPSWIFHWGDDTNNGKPFRAGDCVLQSGVITIKSTGEIDFQGVTYTNHTSSGDIWHATFNFYDSNGVPLFHTSEHDSPRMSDGNGGTIPRSSWNFTETYDKSFFGRIAKVVQTAQC